MAVVLRPGMLLFRRFNVPGKLAILALALLLPSMVGAFTAQGVRTGSASALQQERHGLTYMRSLVRLAIQIAQVRDELTAGGHPEVVSLSALSEVEQLHVDLAEVLDVREEWRRLRALLHEGMSQTHEDPPAPGDPTATFQLAAESTYRLVTEVADSSGLALDGHLDGHYVTMAVATRLPTLVEAACRAQESETARRRGASSDLEARLAAGILTDRASKLRQTLDLAWEATHGVALRQRSGPDLQALDAAVGVLSDSLSSRPPSGRPLPALSAHALWTASLDLIDSLTSGLDGILAQRGEDLHRALLLRAALIALTVLLAVYLFVSLYLTMTSDVRSVLGDISTVTSGGIHQTEPLPGRDEFARMSGAVVYARDQLTALVGALRYQATHDDLTALGNRTLLTEKLEEVLAPREISGPSTPRVGLVVIDLEGFKDVNDSFGHGIGDHLLRTVGARFHKGVRRKDIVARLGGGDFAVLLPETEGEQEAKEIARRLQETLEQPVVVGGRRLRLRVNAGIALGDPGVTGAAELLRNADVAKYAAKELGRGQMAVFQPAMHARARERTELSADLVTALEQGELALLYQPIVDLHSGQIHGAEALVRWQHPVRGDVPPDVFVPLAEATGLIQPIGRWVLRRAAEELVGWQQEFPDGYPLTLDVNLSAAQLTDDGLVEDILSIIDETGVDPRFLVLEITESALMADIDTALRRLGQLSAIGVHLALDDFGTGYSSLSYLLRLPVSVLKIDKSFIAGIGERDDHPRALLRSIVGLGASLGMQTVAEGIEDASQEGLLRDAGCHLGQGYRYAPPLTGTEFLERVRASHTAIPRQRGATGGSFADVAPGPFAGSDRVG